MSTNNRPDSPEPDWLREPDYLPKAVSATDFLAAHEEQDGAGTQMVGIEAVKALAPARAYVEDVEDAKLDAAIESVEAYLPATRKRQIAGILHDPAPKVHDLRNVLDFLRKQTERTPRIVEGVIPDHCPTGTEWLIPKWLPVGRVGLLTGSGGSGKSRLALQCCLGLAAAEMRWLPHIDHSYDKDLRKPLQIEPTATPVRSVIASWEDGPDVIRRRAYKMAAQDGGALGWATPRVGTKVACIDMAGCGPLWGPEEGGSRHVSAVGELTEAGRLVRQEVERRKAGLLVLDPLAAAYGGDENVRPLVRAFMADWEAWARDTGCTVLIIAHPPKSSNEVYSGSTDWHGASRYLWAMTRKELSKKEPTAPRPLTLQLEKSNYSKAGEIIYLHDLWPAWYQTDAPVAKTDKQTSRYTAEDDTGF